MPNTDVNRISDMQKVEPRDVIVYQDPETRQLINTVSERLDLATWRINVCESMLLTTANNDKMQSLEKRVEALEKIVWRLEDYIENWLDL